MYTDECNTEAMLYYLYMMADGDVSYKEEEIFDEICKELNINADSKEAVIKNCRELVDDNKNILRIIIREDIDKQVGQKWTWSEQLKDTSSLARIIWNLVNLGYADSYYSDEEKNIVCYLVDEWGISSEVYQEFVDTADTILALTECERNKNAISSAISVVSVLRVSAASPFAKIGMPADAPEEEFVHSERFTRTFYPGNPDIQHLLDDVELTIRELTM